MVPWTIDNIIDETPDLLSFVIKVTYTDNGQNTCIVIELPWNGMRLDNTWNRYQNVRVAVDAVRNAIKPLTHGQLRSERNWRNRPRASSSSYYIID